MAPATVERRPHSARGEGFCITKRFHIARLGLAARFFFGGVGYIFICSLIYKAMLYVGLVARFMVLLVCLLHFLYLSNCQVKRPRDFGASEAMNPRNEAICW